jgi:hypothetical protein
MLSQERGDEAGSMYVDQVGEACSYMRSLEA